MSRAVSIVCALALIAIVGAPAGAGDKMSRLGEDPAGDAPPALDLTYLEVGKVGKTIEIRIGIERMLPAIGGYPELPGIEWVFQAGERTFVAEAVASAAEPAFYLFEVVGNTFRQLEKPHGTYDPADGYIAIHVPLKIIGAKKGTVLVGVKLEDSSQGDVDAHLHLGPQTHYADFLATDKAYIVP